MDSEPNVLRRHDLASLTAIEDAFREGPLADAADAAPSLERRHDHLTPEQFRSEHRALRRPVVLEGFATDWPAVKTWSFDSLAARHGSTRVIIDSYNSKAAREATLDTFVHLLKTNQAAGAAPVYLQEWLFQNSCPELAEDMPELDIAQYDFRRDLYGDEASTHHQLWLGQKGAITRLHQDSYMVDVMHVQIVGEKRWYVMSPEAELRGDAERDWQALCESPKTRLMQCVLRPGDVLFLPAMWFHRIVLLSDSIGLGRKALDPMNLRMHMRQRLAELLALSLNADEVRQTHPELFSVVISRNRALAKRLQIDLAKLRP